jgi:hypothetical protein
LVKIGRYFAFQFWQHWVERQTVNQEDPGSNPHLGEIFYELFFFFSSFL